MQIEKSEEAHTHVAYSDEAYYHGGNYSSICLISMGVQHAKTFESEVIKILDSSGLNEFKWARTGSARERLCAIKIIDLIHSYSKSKRVRIDTVIWDSRKRKEQIQEDNNKILGKMYFHLYKNVFNSRWPSSCSWALFPDEQGVIDWEEMKRILDTISCQIVIKKEGEGKLNFDVIRDFKISTITEVNSKLSPICQVADFFSGLAAFYHLEGISTNLDLKQVDLQGIVIPLTNKEKERIEIIKYLKSKFAGSSIEITFDFHTGMYTKNPNGQINFWQFKMSLSKYQNEKLQKWF